MQQVAVADSQVVGIQRAAHILGRHLGDQLDPDRGTAADAMRADHIGAISPGRTADLLIVERDPLAFTAKGAP